jgi:choline-glycine betaine transporter
VLPIAARYWFNEMILVLIEIPFACFIISAFYGVKNGFNILYSLLVGFLFLSTVFIFYNDSALIYAIVFSVISVVGNFIGSRMRKIVQLDGSKNGK